MTHKVHIIEATPKNPGLVTAVGSSEGLRIFTNPMLLAIYNAAAGKTTSKFANRSKALTQTWDAIKGFAAVDSRATPPVLYRVGDALPEEVTTPSASGSAPTPAKTKEAPGPGPGRPRKSRPAAKQPDGTYLFDMAPRVPKAAPGGRRPELIAQLRKGPTFRQLQQRFQVNGETDDQRAFNLATHITCMCHVTGYGVRTDERGRLELLEPVAA